MSKITTNANGYTQFTYTDRDGDQFSIEKDIGRFWISAVRDGESITVVADQGEIEDIISHLKTLVE